MEVKEGNVCCTLLVDPAYRESLSAQIVVPTGRNDKQLGQLKVMAENIHTAAIPIAGGIANIKRAKLNPTASLLLLAFPP